MTICEAVRTSILTSFLIPRLFSWLPTCKPSQLSSELEEDLPVSVLTVLRGPYLATPTFEHHLSHPDRYLTPVNNECLRPVPLLELILRSIKARGMPNNYFVIYVIEIEQFFIMWVSIGALIRSFYWRDFPTGKQDSHAK